MLYHANFPLISINGKGLILKQIDGSAVSVSLKILNWYRHWYKILNWSVTETNTLYIICHGNRFQYVCLSSISMNWQSGIGIWVNIQSIISVAVSSNVKLVLWLGWGFNNLCCK